MLETIVAILVFAIFLVLFALILRKAGYSPLWVLLAFIPFVNFLALALFALSEWPIEQELQQLTRKRKPPGDAELETSWELRQLAKRVALLEKLAAPRQPDDSATQLLDSTGKSAAEYFSQTVMSIQQFVERATNDDEKAFAEKLLRTARELGGQIQDG
ncbi:MAG: DUF805 domain-containing protein [Thermoguttaceae bacterium]